VEAQVALALAAQEPVAGELARVAVLVPLHHKVKVLRG
jgi:hypothetical protein